MTRRALLLGCPGAGLTGVAADIATMSALLERHAFTDIVPLVGGDRAAILDALRALIDRTANGDAALLYYSGHGWRVPLPPGRRDGPPDFQGIAPADFHDTTVEDFRGILGDELSAYLDELTEKTANVTAIFDCCHSTGLTRSDAPPPPPGVRALPIPWTVPPAVFHAALAARGLARSRRDPETNPLAVRLFACRADQQASELPDARGGLLTRALADALETRDPGDIVWDDLVRLVDRAVQTINPGQHPHAVGPTRRYLFSLATRPHTGEAACFTRDDSVWIVGGALTDIRPGDRFLAPPLAHTTPATRGGAAPSLAPPRAHLIVTAVDHQLARATTTHPLPDGATVMPVGWGSPRAAIAVRVDPPRRAVVEAAILAAGPLTLAPSHLPTIATVVATATGPLEIHDPDDTLVRTARTLDELCDVLVCLARVDQLRRLASIPGPPDACTITWSRVDDPPGPLQGGTTLPSRARITASAHNPGPTNQFLTLFAACADGTIDLLTRSQPAGVLLAPNATYHLGEDRLVGVRGVPLTGPSHRPHRITLVACVLEAAIPLGAWECAPPTEGPARSTRSPPAVPDFPEHPIAARITTLDVTVA